MRITARMLLLSVLVLSLLASVSESALAQQQRPAIDETMLEALVPDDDADEPLRGFYDTADLSLVMTGGNSASTTLGLRNLAEYYWESSSLRFQLGGLSTESRSRDERIAVGTGGDDFTVVEAERQKTAENYFAQLRYDYAVSERWYTFAIGGWDRNRFSGYDDRWQGAMGVGWLALDTDRTTLRLDVAGTYTSERPTLGATNDFGGVRLAYDFRHDLTDHASVLSTLVLDENLKETEDVRADWFNAIEVSITDLLSLRSSFRILWRNDPLFEALPLFDASGSPVEDGAGNQIEVQSQLDPVDTYFMTSLVLKI